MGTIVSSTEIPRKANEAAVTAASGTVLYLTVRNSQGYTIRDGAHISSRQLSIDGAKRTTDMETQLYSFSSKIDYSLRKFDGLDVQMQTQARYIDDNSTLISAGFDNLGFSIGATRDGLDKLNLAYSGNGRQSSPFYNHRLTCIGNELRAFRKSTTGSLLLRGYLKVSKMTRLTLKLDRTGLETGC